MFLSIGKSGFEGASNPFVTKKGTTISKDNNNQHTIAKKLNTISTSTTKK